MEVLQLGINKEEDISRLVGEAEIWGKWVDISVAEVFLEKWGVPEQSSSARKRSSHKFWLWKTVGIKSEEDRGLLESQAVFLKGPMQGCTQMHLLWVQSLAPKGYMRMNLIAQLIWELEGQDSFLPEEVLTKAIVLLMNPHPQLRAGKWVPYHIYISINLAHTVCPNLVLPWGPFTLNF